MASFAAGEARAYKHTPQEHICQKHRCRRQTWLLSLLQIEAVKLCDTVLLISKKVEHKSDRNMLGEKNSNRFAYRDEKYKK